MIIQNEKDAFNAFREMMKKELNNIIMQSSNNIRVAQIINHNYNTHSASVRLLGTGEIINNVRFQKGVTFNIAVNDIALVISPDPKLKTQNFIAGIY